MSTPRDPNRRPLPIHPGEFLREDYLPELGMSAVQFAEALGVPVVVIDDLLAEKAGLTSELAYRLSIYLETSPEFWMNLQTGFELNTIFHSDLEQMRAEIRSRVAA